MGHIIYYRYTTNLIKKCVQLLKKLHTYNIRLYDEIYEKNNLFSNTKKF